MEKKLGDYLLLLYLKNRKFHLLPSQKSTSCSKKRPKKIPSKNEKSLMPTLKSRHAVKLLNLYWRKHLIK